MKSLSRFCVLFLATASMLVPTSCGCGGGGGGSNPFPSVVATTPKGGVAEVTVASAQVSITATFDRDMDPTTINSSTFLLLGSGGLVSGTVSYANRKATFTPGSDLEKFVDHIAKITTGATDASGKAMNAEFSWSFKTEDRRWQTAEQIDDESLPLEGPTLDILSGGEVRAVWAQGYSLTGGIFNLFSASMSPITKIWGNPAVLGTGVTTPVHEPRIATDDTNKAFLVWEQQTGTAQGAIYARIYDGNTISFGAPVRLDNAAEPIDEGPELASGPGGFAFVAWVQLISATGNYEVRANFYNPFLSSWTGVQTLDLSNAFADNLHVAASGSDHAMVAWVQNGNLYLNHFDIGAGGWQGQQQMESDSAQVIDVALAMDPFGKATLVWTQSDGTKTRVRSRSFDPSSGWAPQEFRDTGAALFLGVPQLTKNTLGTFFATWIEFDGSHYSLWGALSTASAGWGAASEIGQMPDGAITIGAIATALSPTDQALVIMSSLLTPTSAQTDSYRYLPGSGWAPTVNSIYTAGTPTLIGSCAYDAFNRAFAVFQVNPGTGNDIFVNRFE